jgi:hypothetical protein
MRKKFCGRGDACVIPVGAIRRAASPRDCRIVRVDAYAGIIIP